MPGSSRGDGMNDLTQLLCEIAALRREVRAVTCAILATNARNEGSRENYIDQAYENQGAADEIAKGGKA